MGYGLGEIGGVQESWLVFKACLCQTDKWSILMCWKASKGGRRPAWMSKELLTKLKHKKEVCKWYKQGQITWEKYTATL